MIIILAGGPARGDVEKLKPEDPQRSRLEGKEFKANKVVLDETPTRPLPRLYRAWRNPSSKTKLPSQELLRFHHIQPSVIKPKGDLSAWHHKMWKSGKPVRSFEEIKGLEKVLNPLSLKDFNRFVYKRNGKAQREN